MTLTIRFLWAIVTWVVYLLCFYVLFVPAGFVLVPFAIWFGVTRKSRIYPDLEIFTAPRWLHLYGNEEEGYDSAFAISLHPTMNTFWRRWLWAAWRNKFCNFRFIKILHPPPIPSKIRSYQSYNWWLCWQGPFYCFHYTKVSGHIFKIGWKYVPEDALGVDEKDWRNWGCGFTLRLDAN